MFNINDKLTLSLINARDVYGNDIPFQLKLPLSDEELVLPDNLSSIDVFEYHEGVITGGRVIFSIYIGEMTTINKLIDELDRNKVKIIKDIKISSIDSPVCIQNFGDKKIVFASIKEQDIVIEDLKQLRNVIERLSDHFSVVNNAVSKIKTFGNSMNKIKKDSF
ncbi:MAG: hypothetical protein E7165_04695 [Firmicutes bacterium]|nr:hypothetical protein [Bacillota bacterium]